MKKRTFFHGLLMAGMVVVALFLSACGSDKEKLPIPKDAPFVLEIDMKELALKSNFISNRSEIADLIIAEDPEDKELKKLTDMLREDGKTGLNFEESVYVFASKDFGGIYALASVDDKDLFIDNVKSFAKKSVKFKEDGKLTWIEADKLCFGVITKEYLLLGSLLDEDKMMKAKEQKKAFEAILDSKGFFGTEMGECMEEHHGEFTMMLDFTNVNKKKLEDFLYMAYRNLDMPAELIDMVADNLGEAKGVINMEFQKGKIALNSYNMGKVQYKDAYAKISEDAFAQMPGDNMFALIAAGVQGEGLSAALDDVFSLMQDEMSSEESMVLAMVSGIVKSMDGTMAVTVNVKDFDHEPEATVLLPMAYKKAQGILDMIGDEAAELNITGDNKYTAFSTSRAYRYGRNSTPVKSDIANKAAKNYAYIYMDFKQIVKAALNDENPYNLKEKEAFNRELRKFLGLFNYLEATTEKLEESTITLVLSDDSRNALDLLIMKGIDLIKANNKYEKAVNEYWENYDWSSYDYGYEEAAAPYDEIEWDDEDWY